MMGDNVARARDARVWHKRAAGRAVLLTTAHLNEHDQVEVATWTLAKAIRLQITSSRQQRAG